MGLVHFEDGKVLYYPYTPSKGAGYAFMVLFLFTTAGHIFGVVRLKTKFFIPLILGGVCEVFGHYGRAWAGDLPDSPKPFMLQLMLILVSPVFIAATLYVTLGRYKIAILAEPKRRCSPTSFFIITDVAAFCSQIGGGLMQVTGSLKLMRIGDQVVLGGLVFQLFVLIGYFFLIWKFYQKALKKSTTTTRWKPYTIALFVATVAIWIRNLVRAIEFAQGFHGFISEHEAMLYIFDSFLMLMVMVLFGVLHPGMLLQKIERRDAQSYYGMETLK